MQMIKYLDQKSKKIKTSYRIDNFKYKFKVDVANSKGKRRGVSDFVTKEEEHLKVGKIYRHNLGVIGDP